MGLCGSSMTAEEAAQKKRSQQLEKQLAKQHQLDQQSHKLLLLGAGESGKSTLFKQMIAIYGKGFDDNERRKYKPIIHNNVLSSMKTLLSQTNMLTRDHGINCTLAQPQLEASKEYMLNLRVESEENFVLSPEVGQHLKALWQDAGVQKAYANRALFQLTDSAAYYFNRLDEVTAADYLPTGQDVLRSRVRTTGIVEKNFVIDNNEFQLYDVGGQRNERKKWIHCFDNVTAVLFVAAISEYDQVLFEDDTTNRLEEAWTLFDEICNSPYFKKTSMMLFLNKRDLFQEKMEEAKNGGDVQLLSDCIPQYADFCEREGLPVNTYETGVQFMQAAFESKNKSRGRQIYTHVTCATDTSNVRVVFDAVKDIVIRQSLAEGGLMS